jgi:hypothetical protein
MSRIIIEVVRKADNALFFWGAYPADEVTEEGQFRPEDLSEGLHEGVPTQVAGEQEGQEIGLPATPAGRLASRVKKVVPTGVFETLTESQKKKALAHCGDDSYGDPDFPKRVKATASSSAKGTFDRAAYQRAYMREYMRKRRAK